MFVSLFCFFMLVFSFFFNFFQLFFMILMLGGCMLKFICFFMWDFYCFNSVIFYIDYLSFLLMILSFMLIMYMHMIVYKTKMYSVLLINNLLLVSLFFCFMFNSFLFFYIFFEFSMIPLILLILKMGGSLERFLASMFLLLYTLLGSLLFLLFLLFLKLNMYFCLNKVFMFDKSSSLLSAGMILVFLIKMPMYSVHFWLPKAHVEAPVGGSMVLAGVLLKLGLFGLNRLYLFLNLMKMEFIVNILLKVSLLGAVLISMICLRQVDIKMMIAYSSISHMGLMMGGIFSLSMLGKEGSIGLMISHGFCSSALFYMGNLFYERFNTRNLYLFKGGTKCYPLLMSFWLMFSVFNMGVPPSMNFFSEILLVFSILNKSFILMVFICLVLLLSVWYSLNMYTRVSHGMSWQSFYLKKESFLDMFILLSHLIFLFLYLLKMSYFFLV